jgi:hypothetical protein
MAADRSISAPIGLNPRRIFRIFGNPLVRKEALGVSETQLADPLGDVRFAPVFLDAFSRVSDRIRRDMSVNPE